MWYEVPKSKKAPTEVRKALKRGADHLIVWGGDGMVQRCLDAVVGSRQRCPTSTVAIIPAGTANLLAHNLGIPHDLPEAVRHRVRRVAAAPGPRPVQRRALRGHGRHRVRRRHDPRPPTVRLKTRLGRLAYVWTGLHEVSEPPTHVQDQDRRHEVVQRRRDLRARRQRRHRVRRGDAVRRRPPRRRLARRRRHHRPRAGRVGARAGPRQHRTVGSLAVRPDHPRPTDLGQDSRDRSRTNSTAAPATKTDRVKVRVVPACVTVCVPTPTSVDNPEPVR